jgi:hypothetical protein
MKAWAFNSRKSYEKFTQNFYQYPKVIRPLEMSTRSCKVKLNIEIVLKLIEWKAVD